MEDTNIAPREARSFMPIVFVFIDICLGVYERQRYITLLINPNISSFFFFFISKNFLIEWNTTLSLLPHRTRLKPLTECTEATTKAFSPPHFLNTRNAIITQDASNATGACN